MGEDLSAGVASASSSTSRRARFGHHPMLGDAGQGVARAGRRGALARPVRFVAAAGRHACYDLPSAVPDNVSSLLRSRMMAAVRHYDTAPELAVRSFLHRAGLRFRVHVRDLPGVPDIVLPRHRAVVRVHGCFWHGHVRCNRGRLPRSNRRFWSRKIERNRARDSMTARRLRAMGWRVFTVWQCEVHAGRLGAVSRQVRIRPVGPQVAE